MTDLLYIEAPQEWSGGYPSVFLAGGITDCPDWQKIASGPLLDQGYIVLNPRRENFPIEDPTAAEAQIKWEFRHLHYANVVLFWFPASPSPQPIALYELGFHAAKGTDIAVGVSPGYARKADVYHQMRLSRPQLTVRTSLSDTIADAMRLAG